ncbi:Glycosyltransferase involved in cell wall bisynthesis [Lachnospiraceae bacterium KH1T2]|nr:Glycosyltransferase involved in cell wall bisynthesis [Lachnospiraceae bacterium KH1T2]
MKLNINMIYNPTIDILIAVASHGGVEECINMLGRFLKGKGCRVRVIQLVYEGDYWTDSSIEFNYIYSTRENHCAQDFIDGYADFLQREGIPNMTIAAAWPMMTYVAYRASVKVKKDFIIASWLHAPLNMYKSAGYGNEDHLKYADVHFAISNEIASAISQEVPSAVIYRVNNPVNMSKIHRVNKLGEKTLLFVGRLSAEKNIGIILSAIAIAKSSWKLIIVGDGDEKNALQKLAEELMISDRVTFIGWSKDPWKYAQEASALVLSSLYEGSPLAAIEALSCGLPVIANESSKVNEIIIHEKNGYMYPDNNIKELAEILDGIADGALPTISPDYCRESARNYNSDITLYDFYVKIYASSNGRKLFQNFYPKKVQPINDKISVVIPCKNVDKYLKRCLDSVIKQTIGLEHIEIITVDDCSTDDTLKILLDYEKNYPENICVVQLSETQGPGAARNAGLEYCRGEYITFIDSDDCISEDMLELLYLSAVLYPTDVVDCEFEMFSDNMPSSKASNDVHSAAYVIENSDDRQKLFIEHAFISSVWGRLYRKDFLQKNPMIHFPEATTMEDMYFCYCALGTACSWQSIQFKGYYYFKNPSGIMRSKNTANYYMDVHRVFKKLVDTFEVLRIKESCKEELAYVYYKKNFTQIVEYMMINFDSFPKENYEIIREYLKTLFSGDVNNKYLDESEKRMLLNVFDEK